MSEPTYEIVRKPRKTRPLVVDVSPKIQKAPLYSDQQSSQQQHHKRNSPNNNNINNKSKNNKNNSNKNNITNKNEPLQQTNKKNSYSSGVIAKDSVGDGGGVRRTSDTFVTALPSTNK